MIHNKIRIALLAIAVTALPHFAHATNHAHIPKVGITWLGGASTVLEFNGFRILTDPAFGEGKNAFTMGDPNEMFSLKTGPNIRAFERLTPMPTIDTISFDLLLLSHAHEDHFDQEAQRQLSKKIPALAPTEDVEKLNNIGFTNVSALEWGKSRTFHTKPGKVIITAINAHHSANPETDKALGRGNGYWIEFTQGDWKRTVYWTGDTFPTNDVVTRVKSLGQPNIMVAHIGAVGSTGALGKISMGADDAVFLARSISAKKVIPIHHSTYRLFLEPISKLVKQSHGQEYGLDLVSPGTKLQY